MEDSGFVFPRPLGRLVSRLPAFPPSLAFAQVLNLALGRVIPRESLEPLHGKCLEIRVTDLGLSFHFTIGAGGFSAVRSSAPADLVISASAQDFYLLASRKEDPDTLFFSRRLVVEGDTELGLVAKNTLDAVDLPKFTPSLLAPRHVLGLVKARIFQ